MISLGKHHDGLSAGGKIARGIRKVVPVVILTIGLGGCLQGANDFAPAASVTAPAPAIASTPATTTSVAKSASATTPAKMPTTATQAAPVRAAVTSPKVAPPTTAVAPAGTAASTSPAQPANSPPVTAAVPTAATEAFPLLAPATGTFPNINAPTAQPTGKLLPADERQRIIKELEAMRAGQGSPNAPPPAVADLTNQATTHGPAAIKKIEECAAAGAANNPDCAAATQ